MVHKRRVILDELYDSVSGCEKFREIISHMYKGVALSLGIYVLLLFLRKLQPFVLYQCKQKLIPL